MPIVGHLTECVAIRDSKIIYVEQATLSMVDTVIEDNTSVVGAVFLRAMSGSFLRTKFLDNDSSAVSALPEGVYGLVATTTCHPNNSISTGWLRWSRDSVTRRTYDRFELCEFRIIRQ